LDTELSAKNKIQVVGELAVPVLRYSFGIINWHQEELRKLDRKMRKLLTIHGWHHPEEDVDRLYVPRKQGGRGMMQLEEAYIIEITKLMEYGDSTEDPLIQIVRTLQNNINSAVVRTARSLKRELQKGTRQMKDSAAEKKKERWQGQWMHGQFPCNLRRKTGA
jgi:hypothetical protein